MNSDNSQPVKIILMIFALIVGGFWGIKVLRLLQGIHDKLP